MSAYKDFEPNWLDNRMYPEEGCPAVGVMGIHSDAYLEGEGPCQWCGATPPSDPDDA